MKQYLIWDLPTRLFHWLLVASIVFLWYSAEIDDNLIDWHAKTGYFVLGLVIFRVLWGLVGTFHARFVNFIPSFASLKHYSTNSVKTPGHNPLGALMVIAMLVILLVQAVSGLFISDDIFTQGPYFGVLDKEWENTMNWLHHNNITLLWFAIAFHVAAIVFYRVKKKHNLVKPMLTGKKSAEDVKESDAIPHSKLLLALVIAIATAAFVYWLSLIHI